MGLFGKVNNSHYETDDNLPNIHFYLYLNNQEFTDSAKKVISEKLNQIFNESFANKEIKDIVQPDDFETIFFVEDDLATSRKLLHCTVKLSKAIAYCPEALVDQLPKPEPAVTTTTAAAEVTTTEILTEKPEEVKGGKQSKQSKGKKTVTPRKPKAEVVHKAAKDADELEKEAAAEVKEIETGIVY